MLQGNTQMKYMMRQTVRTRKIIENNRNIRIITTNYIRLNEY